MLIDHVRIHVKAGSGGKGCTSFYRDRFVRRGKPNGGPGGPGGNIVFKVDNNIHTLLDFQYNRIFKAGRGGHGGSNNKKGKAGKDLLIRVPAGTILKDSDTGLVLRDLTLSGEEVIVARGGAPGRGNTKDADATEGGAGEEKNLGLELKLIADVAIIGFPNTGKSTFISRISRAKSAIANYAFTTKEPIPGVVKICDTDITFADMPGLIEGAHRGRGLGDEFLRHIERTKILLHMVDVAGVEGRDAYQDYLAIRKELTLYGRHTEEKPEVVACNKMDLAGSRGNLAKFEKEINKRVFPISALTGEGVNGLLAEIGKVYNGR